jgi:hypothetical protein
MANLTEVSNFDTNVYQLDISDPVLGGPGGIANAQAQALANRTKWLKDNLTPLLGKQFASVAVAGPQVVATGTTLNYDGSTHLVAFPIVSPHFTTPNDGTTRTYEITVSAFVDFTEAPGTQVQINLYTTSAGPVYTNLMLIRMRTPWQYIIGKQIITLGPNVRIKTTISNTTGNNATFSEMQCIVKEI